MTTATCESCGGPDARSEDARDQMPYCAACYYSGRASSHYARALLQPLRDAGFEAVGWQTGGGCQNIALPVTEAGFDGAYLLMGSIDTIDPTCWMLGIQLHAHAMECTHHMPGLEWEWVEDHAATCAACRELTKLCGDLDIVLHQIDTLDDLPLAAESLVNAARQIAGAVHRTKEQHT